jgi:hypothetical protein
MHYGLRITGVIKINEKMVIKSRMASTVKWGTRCNHLFDIDSIFTGKLRTPDSSKSIFQDQYDI